MGWRFKASTGDAVGVMSGRMKTIGILNGPNLDRLGSREPGVYGNGTLADLERLLAQKADTLAFELAFFQSNHEGQLVDKLWEWSDAGFAGVVFNPGAYTHTSIALRDAINGCRLTVLEVHISNIYQREEFRRHSLTAPACKGVISGLGFFGYVCALEYFAESRQRAIGFQS